MLPHPVSVSFGFLSDKALLVFVETRDGDVFATEVCWSALWVLSVVHSGLDRS